MKAYNTTVQRNNRLDTFKEEVIICILQLMGSNYAPEKNDPLQRKAVLDEPVNSTRRHISVRKLKLNQPVNYFT